MGTWNTKIKGNDVFLDIYQNFLDLYNQGKNPIDISRKIRDDFAEMFNDYEDKNNSLFGLALAQWETKSLDPIVYKKIKEVIETGNDLQIWKELGADNKTLEKRKKELDKFLTQISTEREKPVRRVKPKLEFEIINLVNAVAPDSLKKFSLNEEYANKDYVHTSGLMMWGQVGGSVLYYKGKGKTVSVKWLDSKSLEITHDINIEFTMKKESAYFKGDDIRIIYNAIELVRSDKK